MFYFDPGDEKPDELDVYDCRRCGAPTVFPRSGGTGICADCAGQPAADAEAARACPVDGAAMVSERRSNVVVDQCPSCRGVWLDACELDRIVAATRAVASDRSGVAGLILNILRRPAPPKRTT